MIINKDDMLRAIWLLGYDRDTIIDARLHLDAPIFAVKNPADAASFRRIRGDFGWMVSGINKFFVGYGPEKAESVYDFSIWLRAENRQTFIDVLRTIDDDWDDFQKSMDMSKTATCLRMADSQSIVRCITENEFATNRQLVPDCVQVLVRKQDPRTGEKYLFFAAPPTHV